MAGAELTRADHAAILEAVRAGAASAASAARGWESRDFRLSRARFRICFAGGRLRDAICRPLDRLVAANGSVHDPELTIHVWSDRIPPVPEAMPRAGRTRPEGEEWSFVRRDVTSVTAFDAVSGEGFLWVEEPHPLPNEIAPLVEILWSWLAPRGATFAHAAAVGTRDGAVLLVGPFASGKSTAMLAGVESGLLCISDDVCVLGERDGEPTVAGIYSSVQTGPRIGEKETRFLGAEQLLDEAPLRAVAVMRRSGDAEASVSEAAGAEALAAIAPASMLWSPGPREATFASLARVIERVPCSILDPGTRPDGTAAAIRSLL